MMRIQELAKYFHLKGTHVPQHHITNPLVVPFDVGIRASLPEETNRFVCCLYYNVIRSFRVSYLTTQRGTHQRASLWSNSLRKPRWNS